MCACVSENVCVYIYMSVCVCGGGDVREREIVCRGQCKLV